MKASLCVFCAFHWVHWSECLPVPLAYTTKLPAQHYGGVDDAAQWLPSGHYEDQLYEVEQVKTMGEIRAERERDLDPCSSKSTNRTILYEGK